MEKINVISIPFYKFKAEDALIKEVYDDVTNLKFISELKTENGFVSHDYYNENLFKFFNESIREFKKVYFDDNIEFPIVDCWVNKYNKLNKLHKHMHPNSIICGLYYVTTHSESQAATVFEAENPWVFIKPNINSVNLSLHDPSYPAGTMTLTGEIMPEQGTLILFPPSLFHYMRPITSISKVRYTIAFNTFASGNISSHRTQVLSLKAISLEDKLNKK